jgi:hypothetical protein
MRLVFVVAGLMVIGTGIVVCVGDDSRRFIDHFGRQFQQVSGIATLVSATACPFRRRFSFHAVGPIFAGLRG